MTILPLVLALGFVAFCAYPPIRTGGRRGPTTEEIVRRAREWKLGRMADQPQAHAHVPTTRGVRHEEVARRNDARDARDVEILGQRRREQAGEPTVTLELLKRRIDAPRREVTA